MRTNVVRLPRAKKVAPVDVPKDRKSKREFGVYYYLTVGDFSFKHDRVGSSSTLINAIGNAVKHCARSELADGEYAQALIFNRHSGTVLRSYKRGSGGDILCKDFT